MADPQYQITGQVQTAAVDPATRKPAYGWDITFLDKVTGTVASVFLAGSPTPDQVAAAINEQLVRIRQIHSLTGE